MPWIVVMTDRVSRLKLYACTTTEDDPVWSVFKADAHCHPEREMASTEMRVRQEKGNCLKGWVLHIEEYG